jgi:hypothetical protein
MPRLNTIRLINSSRTLGRAMFFHKKATHKPVEMIKLKNGFEASPSAVASTMMNLNDLHDSTTGFLAVYDLAQLCKKPDYDISYSKEALLELALVEQHPGNKYTVPDIVKNVVLSAVEGEKLDMTLSSPVAPKTPSPKQ